MVTYAWSVALTVPFIAHRRYPLAALGVTVAAFLALAGLHSAFYPGLQLFAILCGIALHADRRRSLVALRGEPAGDAGRAGAATSRA